MNIGLLWYSFYSFDHSVLTLGGLDSVEYYDITSNEWRPATPMPWRGVTVKCAAVGEIIYVLAGFQGVGRLGHVLEFHTDIDRFASFCCCFSDDALFRFCGQLSQRTFLLCHFRWVTCSKVRAFPVTSCLICVVDTCGVNEDEDMDMIDSQTHTASSSSLPSTSS